MKRNNTFLLASLLVFISTAISSCEAIKGLVGFGFWMGVIVVVIIIIIILWLVGKAKK